jgi:hypothetical protein
VEGDAWHWPDATGRAEEGGGDGERGGLEATRLVSGIIPLLVIAGLLEGFFSPSQAPVWLKFAVGGLLFAMLNLWLFRPVEKQGIGNRD